MEQTEWKPDFRPAKRPENLHRYLSAKLRWELQVEKGPGCWEWQGATTPFGYGRIRANGEHVRAHRFAYEYYRGEIPDGLWVLHHCDNPGCVNPAHLYVGTPQDNVRDRVERGRGASGDRSGSRLYPERLVRGDDHWWAKGNEHHPLGVKNGRAKLNPAKVREIRKLWATGNYTKVELAEMYGVTDVAIFKVIDRQTWKHID